MKGLHLCLTVGYEWHRVPPHTLAVPPDWAKKWDGDFTLDGNEDFVSRAEALELVSNINTRELNEGEAGDRGWCIAVEIGPITPGSFINLDGAAADLNLECSVVPVMATAEEIDLYGALPDRIAETVVELEPAPPHGKPKKKRRKKKAA